MSGSKRFSDNPTIIHYPHFTWKSSRWNVRFSSKLWFSEGTQEWMVNSARNPSVAMEHHLHREKTMFGYTQFIHMFISNKKQVGFMSLLIWLFKNHYQIGYLYATIEIISHKYTYHYVYIYHGPIRAPDSPREAPPRGLCGTPGTGRSATGASLRLWPQQRPGGSQTCGAVNGEVLNTVLGLHHYGTYDMAY